MVCLDLRSVLVFTSSVLILSSFSVANQLLDNLFISNLDAACFQCMCSTRGCNLTRGCGAGDCGPFHISYEYWKEGGQHTPYRQGSYRHLYLNARYLACVSDYSCSRRTIKGYVHRHARDCNNDGVTDCLDFIILHIKGRVSCPVDMYQLESDKNVLQIYSTCVLNT